LAPGGAGAELLGLYVHVPFCEVKCTLGIDRIMWAIDYPYQPTGPAVAFLESASLSDAERAQVAYRNAERIFRITP
jgi:predicted TIM-barrel fold metal-dependent hydrolase